MLEECKVEEGDGEVGVWSAEGCLATLHDLNMMRFYRASMQQESSHWGELLLASHLNGYSANPN